MGIYKNDYEKDADFMMWELHEIRNKLAGKNIQQINTDTISILKKYKLDSLEIKDKKIS